MDDTPETGGVRAGERIVFWAWTGIVSIGLAVMLALPLLGR